MNVLENILKDAGCMQYLTQYSIEFSIKQVCGKDLGIYAFGYFMELHISYVQSQSTRYGLEIRPTSLFDLYVRVYADFCTVKTTQYKILAHYKRFDVCQVPDHICIDYNKCSCSVGCPVGVRSLGHTWMMYELLGNQYIECYHTHI